MSDDIFENVDKESCVVVDTEDFEDDDEDYFPPSLHMKWLVDGIETFGEIADHLEGFVGYIRALEAAGAQLIQPVDNGYIVYEPDVKLSDASGAQDGV